MSQFEDFDQNMAGLIEAGTNRLLDAGKTESEAAEAMGNAITVAAQQAAPDVVKSLLRGAPRMLREHRRLSAAFDKRLHKDWGKGLDLMYAAIVSCGEAGETFYQRQTLVDDQVQALAGLHARAWRTTTEAHLLLSHGFPAGAMARARTLHELAVVALVISSFGREQGSEDLAERYLLHGRVMANKEAQSYQANAAVLGITPYTDDEMKEMQAASDELVKRFGKSFATTHGWASRLLSVESPNFAELEKRAELSHLRPYYAWESHSVHADSRGWALNQYNRAGQTVMAAGATNVGLADPAQLSMIAFMQCTVSLLSSPIGGPTSTMDQLAMHSILLLIDEAQKELVAVEPKIMARERAMQEATARDSRP